MTHNELVPDLRQENQLGSRVKVSAGDPDIPKMDASVPDEQQEEAGLWLFEFCGPL